MKYLARVLMIAEIVLVMVKFDALSGYFNRLNVFWSVSMLIVIVLLNIAISATAFPEV